MMTHRLIYSSRSVGHVWLQVAQDIVRTSLENNPQIEVTGCLCCSASGYLQLIEGPADSIDTLFAKIQRDSRHADIRLSERVAIESRQFGAWAMAFAPRLPAHEPMFEKHMPAGTSDFSVLAPAAQGALLLDLVPLANQVTRDLARLTLSPQSDLR